MNPVCQAKPNQNDTSSTHKPQQWWSKSQKNKNPHAQKSWRSFTREQNYNFNLTWIKKKNWGKRRKKRSRKWKLNVPAKLRRDDFFHLLVRAIKTVLMLKLMGCGIVPSGFCNGARRKTKKLKNKGKRSDTVKSFSRLARAVTFCFAFI